MTSVFVSFLRKIGPRWAQAKSSPNARAAYSLWNRVITGETTPKEEPTGTADSPCAAEDDQHVSAESSHPLAFHTKARQQLDAFVHEIRVQSRMDRRGMATTSQPPSPPFDTTTPPGSPAVAVQEEDLRVPSVVRSKTDAVIVVATTCSRRCKTNLHRLDRMTRFLGLSLTVVLCLLRIQLVHANTAAGLETLVGIRGPDFVLLGADTAVGPGVIWTATRVDKIASIGSNSKTLVALAGDAADANFLVNLLQAKANLYEYQSGLGSVGYVRIEQKHKQKEGAASTSAITVSTTKEGNEYTVLDIAQLAREQIAQQLRSPSQCRVCLLVAGLKPNMNQAKGPAPTQRLQAQVQQASQLVGKKVAAAVSGVSATEATLDEDNEAVRPQLYWLDELGTMINVPYGSHGVGSMFMNSILDEGYHPNLTRKEACALMQKCFQQLRQRYAVQTPQPPILKCIDHNGIHMMPLENLN